MVDQWNKARGLRRPLNPLPYTKWEKPKRDVPKHDSQCVRVPAGTVPMVHPDTGELRPAKVTLHYEFEEDAPAITPKVRDLKDMPHPAPRFGSWHDAIDSQTKNWVINERIEFSKYGITAKRVGPRSIDVHDGVMMLRISGGSWNTAIRDYMDFLSGKPVASTAVVLLPY